MAQGVRPQREVAARPIRALAIAWLAGASCARETAPLPPLPADPLAAIENLVARLHGPLRGTLDRITVEMRTGGVTGAVHTIYLNGRQVRVRRPDGSVELLLEGGAWRIPPKGEAVVLDASTRQELESLRGLLAGAYLAPLYEARSIAWEGPAAFAIVAADGTAWRLEIDPATQLPRSLSGPAGDVRFASFFSTGVTELPADVELGVLGKQHLKLLAHGVLFDAAVFRAPDAAAALPGPVLRRGANEPQQPAVQPLAARPFVVIDDPGAWPARAAAIAAVYQALAGQGQVEEGLPFLFELDGKPQVGVPFAAGDGSAGAFVAPEGQRVALRTEQSAVVLYRPKEDFDASRAAGARAVQDYARRAGLTVQGPLRVIPHLAWDADLDPATLTAVKLRFELPVAPAERSGK